MEPRIQYAQTADGVSIAFWTLGEGMPLVVMPLGSVIYSLSGSGLSTIAEEMASVP